MWLDQFYPDTHKDNNLWIKIIKGREQTSGLLNISALDGGWRLFVQDHINRQSVRNELEEEREGPF